MNLDQVKVIDIPSHDDNRGILSSIEEKKDIPIEIKRIFYIHNISEDRGGHANIDTDQILIPVHGSLKIRLFDKFSSNVFSLDDPKKGLFIPRLIYLEMYDFSKDSVLLVLANTEFNNKKYLRSRDEYYSYINEPK